ncbi:MAG: hypothetical protein IMY86_06050 [Chloroflexi bacterium]|nr:hypothetical protein [Chloroflexota bacterium]
MSNRRCALMTLAFVVLVASGLACSVPRPTSAPQAPPATVTPYIPVTTPPQETQPSPPTDTTPGATLPSEPPEATASPEPPAATNTPPPPTNTPPPPVPTTPPSGGPLDFDPPTQLHSWESMPDGRKKVVLLIHITGGTPPFTIKHDGNVAGEASGWDYPLEFFVSGCTGIVHNITVESADGQSVSHDYMISTDQQPWCP